MTDAVGATDVASDVVRARLDDGRGFDVNHAMASQGATAIEVYVGWSAEPVHVAFRGYRTGIETWVEVGPRLKMRVLNALEPLFASGWQIGDFAQSVRWDMSRGAGGDLYEGCWVRLHRSA